MEIWAKLSNRLALVLLQSKLYKILVLFMWQVDILNFCMVIFQYSRNRIYNFQTVEGKKKKKTGKQAKITIPKKSKEKAQKRL